MRVLAALVLMAAFAAAADVNAMKQQLRAASAEAQARGVSGVCVVVGRDGVMFAEGFGPNDAPVDVETTQFRLASISKLFAGIAVMQHVEAGRLDLDAPVNVYLDTFQLLNPYATPITLRRLLTHTAGFDDQFVGIAARRHAELQPLGAYLAVRMPRVVLPPGTVMSYSNHGTALAGHIAAEAAGTSFGAYARQHIFAPLDMAHSVFDLPPQPPPNLLTGHARPAGETQWMPAPYDWPNTVPASSLIASGGDMARFMRMFLNGGELDGTRILTAESVDAMMAPQFRHSAQTRARGLAFVEAHGGRQRAVAHGGQIWGFASELVLWPDAGVGLFLSANREPFGLEHRFLGAVVEHLGRDAERAPMPDPLPAAQARAQAAAGVYRYDRYARTSYLKTGVLIPAFVQEMQVTPLDAGRLGVRFSGGGAPRTYAEVAPGEYARIDDDGRIRPRQTLALRTSAAGATTHVFVGSRSYQRVPWYASQGFVQVAGLASAAAHASAAVLGLCALIVLRFLRRPGGRLWWAVGSFALFALIGGGFLLALFSEHHFAFGYAPTWPFRLLLALPVLYAALLPGHVFALGASYTSRGTWPERLLLPCSCAAHVASLALLTHLNLMGWQLGGGGAFTA